MFIRGKNLNSGTYLFNRYIKFNDKKQLINTYKIEKNKNEYRLHSKILILRRRFTPLKV